MIAAASLLDHGEGMLQLQLDLVRTLESIMSVIVWDPTLHVQGPSHPDFLCSMKAARQIASSNVARSPGHNELLHLHPCCSPVWLEFH